MFEIMRVWSWLSLSLAGGAVLMSTTASSFADTPQIAAQKSLTADAVENNTKAYPFLYPGFHFLIQPGSEGGQSIAALYDGEGFILCLSQQNPSDAQITAPFQCNNRITPAGFHIPAKILFGDTGFAEKAKTAGKLTLFGIFSAVSAFSVSAPALISESAQAAYNATSQQTPAQGVIEQYQLNNTMKQLEALAKKGTLDCDSTFPTELAPFFVDDLVKDLEDRIRSFEKKCQGYPDTLTAKQQKDPDAVYCHEQKTNQQMASNVMADCKIPAVGTQSGEAGGTELWYPGENESDYPAITACYSTLKTEGSVDANGNPVLDPTTGYNISGKGAPLLAWLAQEKDKLKGITPTTANNAVAQQVLSCLSKNPTAQAALSDDIKKAAELFPTAAPAAPAQTTPAASSATAGQ